MDRDQRLEELTRVLQDVVRRVYQIEQRLGLGAAGASAPGASDAQVGRRTAAAEEPSSAAPAQRPAEVQRAGSRAATSPASMRARENLESRIGSHWANRAGIAAVLVGVSYFLKYAFENHWIGPGGQVSIGLFAGIAVIGWSEWFRAREYRAFSYSLKAVGTGVLYLSLWAALQVYHLVPAAAAFAAMIAVTAATVTMAWREDAEILAALAVAGGLLTPVLLSTGENREVALFSYIAVLDGATLVLASVRPWRRLLALSFLGTLLLYLGWYEPFYFPNELGVTLGYATLFFAMFAVAPLTGRSARAEAGAASSLLPLVLALTNAAVYFLEVYAMLPAADKESAAWLAAGLAAVYLALSRQPRAEAGRETARRLRLLHVALAVGFISVAIPIRLEAHWITIGWFVEAAALLWVSQRIKSDFLAGLSFAALALGVGRLLLYDNFETGQVLWNARLATYGVAVAVLGAVAWSANRRRDRRGEVVMRAAVVALNVLALVGLSREVSDYFLREQVWLRPQAQAARWTRDMVASYKNIAIRREFTFSALWMGYGAMLMAIGFWKKSAFVRWQALALMAFTTVKVFVYDVSELQRVYRILSFIALGILLLAVSFAYQRDWLRLSRGGEARTP